MVVDVEPDHWLKERSDKLVTQRNQADLRETKLESALEQRIDSNDH
jgi:hypothetical protein